MYDTDAGRSDGPAAIIDIVLTKPEMKSDLVGAELSSDLLGLSTLADERHRTFNQL